MGAEKGSINYTVIREELSSGGCLEGECLESFLSIGLEYTSDLIEEKKLSLVRLEQQTEEFKQYLTKAVLLRLIMMRNLAVKGGIENAGSITLFGELRDGVCGRLSLPKELLPEDLLSNLFTKGFESFYNGDPDPGVMRQLDLVSRFASIIVPNNPPKAVEPTRYIAD